MYLKNWVKKKESPTSIFGFVSIIHWSPSSHNNSETGRDFEMLFVKFVGSVRILLWKSVGLKST